MRQAKIVCTLGPASSDRDTIEALASAGMDVARLNTSHGTIDERSAIIDHVQAVTGAVGRPIATMIDLRGPEIRTADVDGSVDLTAGDTIRFVNDQVLTEETIGVTLDLGGVEPGARILLDDGRIAAEITDQTEDGPVAVVRAGGTLTGRAGVNIPGVRLDVDTVSDADAEDLDLAVEAGVDFVAASFVADRDDVLAVSEALEERGGDIPIIAKIERETALDNIDGIIDAAYGVMVARGDLGVECPLEDVPIIQKQLIRRCRRAGVPVITATEMLDSMVTSSRPTRAEASDVANAVLDGSDAVMLSGETAIGDNPVGVVETMATLIETVEASDEYADIRDQRIPPADGTDTDALARSARFLARDLGASAVVVASESGFTALKTAKFRPEVPIVAVSPRTTVRRRLALSGGITPQSGALPAESGDVIKAAADAAIDTTSVTSGDTLVVLSGVMTDVDRETANTLQVHIAAERVGVGAGVVSGEVAGPVVRSDDGNIEGIPDGAILYLTKAFSGELTGDLDRLGGIIHERPGMTGYPALVARELGIPMASGLSLPNTVRSGDIVTLHGDRGVVYLGDVADRRPSPPQ